MRIILMNIQMTVLLFMAFLIAMAGSGLAGMSTLAVGTGPAALGGVFIIVTLAAAALIGLVAFVIPLSIFSSLSLLFGLLAGWRYLRWCRFLGIAANFAGAAYFVAVHFAGYLPLELLCLFLAYHFFTIVLFLLFPRRPNLRLTKWGVAIAQPLLYLGSAGTLAFLIAISSAKMSRADLTVIIVILLLFGLPYVYNYFAVPWAAKPPGKRLAWKLGISLVIATAAALLFFPLGIFIMIGTLMLFQLAEVTLLYPAATPPAGGVQEWVARILGRLPEGWAPAAGRADSGNGGKGDGWAFVTTIEEYGTKAARWAEEKLAPYIPDFIGRDGTAGEPETANENGVASDMDEIHEAECDPADTRRDTEDNR